MRRSVSAGLAGLGVVALLAVAPAGAWGAEPTPSASASVQARAAVVDFGTQLSPGQPQAAPGSFFSVWASLDLNAGTPPNEDFTVTLAKGLTYVGVDPDNTVHDVCTPTADLRAVTCRKGAHGNANQNFQTLDLKVGDEVPLGTKLSFTITSTTAYPDDPTPANNSTTATVTVGRASDWSVAWDAPTGAVQPGTPVTTHLTLTNHGPTTDTASVAISHLAADGSREPAGTAIVGPTPGNCEPQGGREVCGPTAPVRSGQALAFTYTWTFPESARGETLRLATFLLSSKTDPKQADNRTTLVVKVADRAAPPVSPPPTSAPPTGGGTDWGLTWDAPATAVPTHTPVPTFLVLTNYGPGAGTNRAAITFPANDQVAAYAGGGVPAGCDADSGEIDCDVSHPLAAGRTITFPFTWNFRNTGTMRLPTALRETDHDPNAANDKDTLVVKVVKGAAKPPASGGASGGTSGGASSGTTGGTSGSTTGGSSGGSTLPATGSGGTEPLLFAAGGVLALGGGALVLATRLRRHR